MPKTLVTATVDRLLHHAHVVLAGGSSLRLSEATAGRGAAALICPEGEVRRSLVRPQGSPAVR